MIQKSLLLRTTRLKNLPLHLDRSPRPAGLLDSVHDAHHLQPVVTGGGRGGILGDTPVESFDGLDVEAGDRVFRREGLVLP